MLKETKQMLSGFLCVVMLLSLMPRFQLPARAAEDVEIPADILAEPAAGNAVQVVMDVVAQGTCGANVSWYLSDTGTLLISGTGPMDDYATASASPWYGSRTAIKTVQISDGVTSIGDRAFYNCTSMIELTIGKDVTVIGTYAVRSCTGLPSVTIPSGVTQLKGSAFRGCTALTVVRLEGNAPELGTYVFAEISDSVTFEYCEGCTGYDVSPWAEYTHTIGHAGTWVVTAKPTCTTDGSRYINCTYCGGTYVETIPGGHLFVDDICVACGDTKAVHSGSCGSNAKWKLDKFGTLTISGSGSMYHTNTPEWRDYRSRITAVVIRDGITSIGANAFYGCTDLTGITIPDSVTSIGDYAFAYCSSLNNVTIPLSVTQVGSNVFHKCSKLTDMALPGSLDTAGVSKLYNKESLRRVTILEGSTEIEAFAFADCTYLTSVTIPGSVTNIGGFAFNECRRLTKVTIPNGVTSIGTYAFYGCISLTSVTISESVTSIGTRAFYGCTDLPSITIPNGVIHIEEEAFYGCTDLTSVTLSESVACIGTRAFAQCSLTSVTIPGSVTSMGKEVFYACSSLTSVTISEGVTGIGERAFCDCTDLTSVTIPDSVTSIGEGLFRGCTGLTGVTIPDSVTEIGPDAFYYCIGLTGITIPDRVTEIGEKAFAGCAGLPSITIPDRVTEIGAKAFAGCTGLTSVTISESVTCIGEEAFSGCTGLTAITIPGSVISFGPSVFYGCKAMRRVTISEGVTSIGEGLFRDCTGLTGVTIPDSVTSIGSSAFSGCISLTSVTIPDSVTGIGSSAFSGCTGLPSVTIPDSVTGIGSSAFSGCISLTSVTIPESVTSIGASAFSGCTGLTSVTLSEGVSKIVYSMFSGCTGLTSVTIPESVTEIRDSAFENCTSLIRVTIPDSVTTISKKAFYNCERLTSITLPNSVTKIEAGAFGECKGLKSITFCGPQPSGPAQESMAIFENVTALVYHSCTDETWKVKQSPFGSKLTWVGHLIDDYRYNEDATCNNDGTMTGQCRQCGTKSTVPSPSAVEVHQWDSEGCCTLCNKKRAFTITLSRETGVGDSYYLSIYRNGVRLRDISSPNGYLGTGYRQTIVLRYDPNFNYEFRWVSGNGSVWIDFMDNEVFSGSGNYFYQGQIIYSRKTTDTYHQYEKLTVPSTCRENGVVDYCCIDCGAWYQEVLPAGGHHFSGNRCTVCGITCNHSYISKITTPVTCTTAGAQILTCSKCDYSCSEIIPATGHSYTSKVTTPVTCTADGVKTFTCSGCAHSYTESIPSSGHFCDTKVTAATCTTAGVKIVTCAKCDYSSTETTPALGHSFVGNQCSTCGKVCTHSFTTQVTAATCTVDGVKTFTCSGCGYSYTVAIYATGHRYGSNGSCTVCAFTPKITVSLIDDWGCWAWDGGIEVYADGKLVKTVLYDYNRDEWPGPSVDIPVACGEVYSFRMKGSATEEAAFQITFDGQILASGRGNEYSDGDLLYTTEKMVAHRYQAVTTQPTCTEDGSAVYTCGDCGDQYTEVLAATGHQFLNNCCEVCGYRKNVVLVLNVTSFGEGDVVLHLTPDEPGVVLRLTADEAGKPQNGVTGTCSCEIAPGEYVLAFSKENHVTREYAVTLGEGTQVLDIKLHQIGDLDGNGKINSGDVAKLYAHLKGSSLLTDEYMLACANVNGGKLNMGDVGLLYAHIKGSQKLF